MCGAIELLAWDGLVIVGAILLILWILALVGVIHIATGGLEYIFLVLALIFIIAWIFTRFCYGGRRCCGSRAVVV
ncbi:hypothetical protein BGZ83_008591 [Gryganskiella cystojenkinii]|nr:hypothetical protein BGZ83_008591 [Gryganskiella cystojenkinii]